MDEILYNALSKYYHALSLKGYMPEIDSDKLLVLIFLRDFILNDYRELIKEKDYHVIEEALDCIYGTSCLIPYPKYLKMGRLYLGQVSEMAERLKHMENKEVVKVIKPSDEMESEMSTRKLSHTSNDVDSDVMVVMQDD